MQNYMKLSGILEMTVEEFFVNPSFDRQRGGLLVFFPLTLYILCSDS